jgi:SAF domain
VDNDPGHPRIRAMMCPVDLGIMEAPVARRASSPHWRDPRLWLGLAIVAASVVVGSLVLGSSDETVPVWAAAHPLGAGHVLTADDLSLRRVRFDDPAAASLYLSADHQLPPDLTLRRDIGAGELVPRAALGATAGPQLRQVPVSVSPGQVPASLRIGDAVDVYVRPDARAVCQASSACDGRPAVSAVRVLADPPVDEAFGSDGSRTLVLGMSPAQARRFFTMLATTDGAGLTVVGRG